MTQSTEQERATREDFEHWATSTNQGYDLTRNHSGRMQTYEHVKTEHAWRGFFHGWQAARRAQVAPVPLSDELPKGFISDVLTAAGLVRHGSRCKALADRLGVAIEKIWAVSIAQRETLAAAPQPPEATVNESLTAEAAQVQPPKACTCPGGDGSLRWPCPQHPPKP